jgi:hypothetical protein
LRQSQAHQWSRKCQQDSHLPDHLARNATIVWFCVRTDTASRSFGCFGNIEVTWVWESTQAQWELSEDGKVSISSWWFLKNNEFNACPSDHSDFRMIEDIIWSYRLLSQLLDWISPSLLSYRRLSQIQFISIDVCLDSWLPHPSASSNAFQFRERQPTPFGLIWTHWILSTPSSDMNWVNGFNNFTSSELIEWCYLMWMTWAFSFGVNWLNWLSGFISLNKSISYELSELVHLIAQSVVSLVSLIAMRVIFADSPHRQSINRGSTADQMPMTTCGLSSTQTKSHTKIHNSMRSSNRTQSAKWPRLAANQRPIADTYGSLRLRREWSAIRCWCTACLPSRRSDTRWLTRFLGLQSHWFAKPSVSRGKRYFRPSHIF